METVLTEEELTEALGVLDIPLNLVKPEQAQALLRLMDVVEALARAKVGDRPEAKGDA